MDRYFSLLFQSWLSVSKFKKRTVNKYKVLLPIAEAIDDKEEKSLEEKLHKRDVELPLVKKGLEEKMEEIKKSLKNVEREVKVLDIEIDGAWRHLNLTGVGSTKTIMDIPELQWRNIRAEFVHQEHHLMNACLASAELESLITENSPATKFKILGEKVFSVMVRNYYVNGGDLMNCLNTGSKDVETFAGMSWWLYLQSRFYGQNKVGLQVVKMMSLKCIQDFHEKASKEQRKWILFRNKHLTFESRRIKTKSENEMFWNAAFSLLKEFGGFVISLQIKDNSPFSRTEDNTGNFDVDLSLIPRMKFFETRDLVLSAHLNKKTSEPFFLISADFNKLEKSSMFKSIRHSITRVSLSRWTPIVREAHRPDFLQLAKELDIRTVAASINFVNVCKPTICKAETVVFKGNLLYPMDCISFLNGVPHVKKVILDIDSYNPSNGIHGKCLDKNFPTVTHFTWGIKRKFLGSMDALPDIFPNLRHLKLKCIDLQGFPNFRELLVFWNVANIFDEYAIDVFQLYTENISLRESNIWLHFAKLKLFCVQSLNFLQPQPEEILALAAEGTQRQMYFGGHEIYTRMEDGSIRYENVISPID